MGGKKKRKVKTVRENEEDKEEGREGRRKKKKKDKERQRDVVGPHAEKENSGGTESEVRVTKRM